MGEMIERLYMLSCEGSVNSIGKEEKENMDKEWDLYFLLYGQLSIETKKVFNEYLHLREERYKRETKSAFERGFKEAIQLIKEGLNQ